jgi:hypothetical protein
MPMMGRNGQFLHNSSCNKESSYEAAAANKACLSLTRNAALEVNIEDDQTKFLLRDTIRNTMKCFSDLLVIDLMRL